MTGVDPNGILTALLTLALCSTNVGWGTRGTPTAEIEIRCMQERPYETCYAAFIQASCSTVLHCVGRGAGGNTCASESICSRSIGFCPTIWTLIGTVGWLDMCWHFRG